MYLKTLFSLMCILFASAMSGQTLLKDVFDLYDGGSSPHDWTAISNDVFIFQGIDALAVNTLFASDGTTAGTIGLGHYQIDSDIIRFGDRAFFGGCNIFLGVDSCFSLYTSDGTVAGTEFFFDLVPGGISLEIANIVAGDSLFYFSGGTIEEGYELWRSNGTVTGTYRIKDIAIGATSGYSGKLAVIDDIAYFAGYTNTSGIEAWRSDGTAAGTYMITELNDGVASSFPSGFTASGGYIYFSGLGTGSGVEVRRTTGEQGNIELIGEMGGTTDSSNPRNFVDSDGRLYYVAEGNDVAGYDLFVYDHVGDPVHLELTGRDIFPRALMPFGDGEVIFNADQGDGRELWRSDGTIAGTYQIIDLYPGELDGLYGAGVVGGSFYMCHDSLVYFAGADGVNASGEFVYELFVSDGTEAGTKLVSDHFPGTEGTNPGNFFELGDRLYFAATDPIVGREPFYIGKGMVSSTIESGSAISFIKPPFPNPLIKGNDLISTITLEKGSDIQTQLFDLLGRPKQAMQSLGYFSAGQHVIQIQADYWTSGIYKLVLSAGEGQISFLVVME